MRVGRNTVHFCCLNYGNWNHFFEMKIRKKVGMCDSLFLVIMKQFKMEQVLLLFL